MRRATHDRLQFNKRFFHSKLLKSKTYFTSSGPQFLTYHLEVYMAYIYSVILSGIYSILTNFLAYLLIFFLAFYLAHSDFLFIIFSGIHFGILSGMRSGPGPLHCIQSWRYGSECSKSSKPGGGGDKGARKKEGRNGGRRCKIWRSSPGRRRYVSIPKHSKSFLFILSHSCLKNSPYHCRLRAMPRLDSSFTPV